MLISPQNAMPLVDVTVELLSKVERPYLFAVTAVGKPPHAHVRTYKIRAHSDDDAAVKGIEQFVKEFSNFSGDTVAPKAQLV